MRISLTLSTYNSVKLVGELQPTPLHWLMQGSEEFQLVLFVQFGPSVELYKSKRACSVFVIGLVSSNHYRVIVLLFSSSLLSALDI